MKSIDRHPCALCAYALDGEAAHCERYKLPILPTARLPACVSEYGSIAARLSKAEAEKRKPLPPEILACALQDRIHETSGRLLSARAIHTEKKCTGKP